MKKLLFYLVMPLTIIAFATMTKWWYVVVVDGTDEILIGFPFPFVCPGFHTSMSIQIFVLELIIDLLTYFCIIFILIYIINKFIWKIKITRVSTIVLYTMCGTVFSAAGLIAAGPNNLFFLSRPFDIEIMETGYKFTWQNLAHPDYYKYHP